MGARKAPLKSAGTPQEGANRSLAGGRRDFALRHSRQLSNSDHISCFEERAKGKMFRDNKCPEQASLPFKGLSARTLTLQRLLANH